MYAALFYIIIESPSLEVEATVHAIQSPLTPSTHAPKIVEAYYYDSMICLDILLNEKA